MAPLAWTNDAPPAGASDCCDGASHEFDRGTTDGGPPSQARAPPSWLLSATLRGASTRRATLRSSGGGSTTSPRRSSIPLPPSPYDLALQILDATGHCITRRPDVSAYLHALRDTIWGWSAAEWTASFAALKSLQGGTCLAAETKMLHQKATSRWELNAQWAAERVFGREAHEAHPVYLYGPQGLNPKRGSPTSADDGIPDACELRISTTIDGRRDSLSPFTRTIRFTARRDEYPISEYAHVEYLVAVPAQHSVASTHSEFLDWRPSVKGLRLSSPLLIRCVNPPRAKVCS